MKVSKEKMEGLVDALVEGVCQRVGYDVEISRSKVRRIIRGYRIENVIDAWWQGDAMAYGEVFKQEVAKAELLYRIEATADESGVSVREIINSLTPEQKAILEFRSK